MRRLYMTHAWSRQLFGSTQYNPPSRFFDEIPAELIESKGNVTGRSSYGRQSYRRRDERGYDSAYRYDPPPYRRARNDETGGIDINADILEERRSDQDAHADRVVEAALRAGQKVVEPANSQELGLSIGDRVEHPAFGSGVVIAIDGEGDKTEAVINFSNGVGLKHLSLAWAPLKKV
jgi:DNA helicase-2/ATP-dependent DNA helicase PcrA